MRIRLFCSQSNGIIDWNYQYEIARCIHRWLGKDNPYHGNKSFFCFSAFQNVTTHAHGLEIIKGSNWVFSTVNHALLTSLIQGIQSSPQMFSGIEVEKVMLLEEPYYLPEMQFTLNSPVILKKKSENGGFQFTLYNQPHADELLTENMKHKLDLNDMAAYKEGLEVRFAKNHPAAKTKLIDIKGIKNKGSLCPVIISGQPEAIRFAWHVGVGSNNGMGFGFLN